VGNRDNSRPWHLRRRLPLNRLSIQISPGPLKEKRAEQREKVGKGGRGTTWHLGARAPGDKGGEGPEERTGGLGQLQNMKREEPLGRRWSLTTAVDQIKSSRTRQRPCS